MEITKDMLKRIVDSAYEEISDLKLAAKNIECLAKEINTEIDGPATVKKSYLNAIYENLQHLDEDSFEQIKKEHGFGDIGMMDFAELYAKVAMVRRVVPCNGVGKEEHYDQMKRAKQGVNLAEIGLHYGLSTEQ